MPIYNPVGFGRTRATGVLNGTNTSSNVWRIHYLLDNGAGIAATGTISLNGEVVANLDITTGNAANITTSYCLTVLPGETFGCSATSGTFSSIAYR